MRIIKLIIGAACTLFGGGEVIADYVDIPGWIILIVGLILIYSAFFPSNRRNSASGGSSGGDSGWSDFGGGDGGGGD